MSDTEDLMLPPQTAQFDGHISRNPPTDICIDPSKTSTGTWSASDRMNLIASITRAISPVLAILRRRISSRHWGRSRILPHLHHRDPEARVNKTAKPARVKPRRC